MTELLLNATDVAKHYGAVVALRSASLAVRPGEVHALMGANGQRGRSQRDDRAVVLGDIGRVQEEVRWAVGLVHVPSSIWV